MKAAPIISSKLHLAVMMQADKPLHKEGHTLIPGSQLGCMDGIASVASSARYFIKAGNDASAASDHGLSGPYKPSHHTSLQPVESISF